MIAGVLVAVLTSWYDNPQGPYSFNIATCSVMVVTLTFGGPVASYYVCIMHVVSTPPFVYSPALSSLLLPSCIVERL